MVNETAMITLGYSMNVKYIAQTTFKLQNTISS